ncbi:serine/threonine-protein kinase [Nocardia sp. NRRL S-836]|uniref:serine/threonine-protein kinase n=1 Tax=Nocardia sp. NRRL S-836 TaxID=1519492 RepID=UPI0006B014A3|nr:serine/threonine-protein kinase [Nocardia sp. NRRL S-836]
MKVGQGAMGVVWQAYDENLHRVVAAKELLVLDGLDDSKIERAKHRAMREARLAARLEHPNAIRVYDAVEDNGQPWLIMEYLPSRSLAAVIAEQGTLPPREVARIGCYTAAALAAAHRNGIQHRDVKPGNVLIGDQEVKITDFGVSRATGDDGTATATGTVGTPAFFSPEIARGEEAGFPSDVFSLGATLYNAVEGTPPFGAADNHIAMLHRVASGSIMPPANAGPLLSPVLFRLLATDPERRPTMEEAVHLLAAVVNETPQVSEATAVIPATVQLPVEAMPEEKAKQQKKAGAAATGAAAAGLVAGAAQAEAAGLTAPGQSTPGNAADAASADGSQAAAGTTDAAQADASQTGASQTGADQTGADQTGADQTGADQANAGHADAGQVGAGAAGAAQASADQADAGQAGADNADAAKAASTNAEPGDADAGQAGAGNTDAGQADRAGTDKAAAAGTAASAAASSAQKSAPSAGEDGAEAAVAAAAIGEPEAAAAVNPPVPDTAPQETAGVAAGGVAAQQETAAVASNPAATPHPTPAAAPPASTHPGHVPPAPVDPPAPAPPAEEERRNPLALIGIIILVIAVGVGAFLLWPKGNRSADGGSPSGTPSPPATSQSQPQQSEPQQTQPQQTTTQSPPPQENPPQSNPQNTPGNTPPPPATPGTAQEALTNYYALIPNNLEAGYATLTDRFKATRTRTFGEYQQWWGQFSSVELSDFAPQGENVVTATLTYRKGGAVSTTERNTYTLVLQNGKWMIDSQTP